MKFFYPVIFGKSNNGKLIAYFSENNGNSLYDIENHKIYPNKFKSILETIDKIHGKGFAGLDIKPLNIVYCDSKKKYYLIDVADVKKNGIINSYTPSYFVETNSMKLFDIRNNLI